MSKVFIASDHAGFALKSVLIEQIRMLGYEVEDMGAYVFNPEDDYPDFVTPCARAAASDAAARGIVIGKSGEGEAMCANRVRGVRAAVFYGGPQEIIKLSREHNNANMLSLGAQCITPEEAKEAVKQFLETPFSDSPRHARRLAKF
ncbi:ribose-5-phosphate isomerase [Candidatus Kaiserbacteria bacterium RIFOXYD1_FULL_47_14]|uniref:Ribose-5-phosphate isomerase n=1 Tax=Candidatus Kaiserbacteria bacterium RIFOXYD1_FULL_47_14 TaxID=1798533 RepID=A0A1F6G5J2_9BACT|nr:MAG: ribose-5-phosphate isomerase [Candidatus Kaiserbacteria bacterium RIFOXYD1_FULL_47_14]